MVWESSDPSEFVARFADANRRWKLPIDVALDATGEVFVVTSDGSSVAVARPRRIRRDYSAGVEAREQQLITEYLLDNVPFSPGDLVVDIGANIGEVSLLLAKRFSVIPFAFEPDRTEFRALEHNMSAVGGRAWNALLWSHRTELDFHQANDWMDSGIFEPPRFSEKFRRTAVPLDDALADALPPDARIRLLKLEAEGAEPEILEGATRTLEHVDYVVADVGPERGPSNETTLIPVYEHLRSYGFRATALRLERLVMLFHRE